MRREKTSPKQIRIVAAVILSLTWLLAGWPTIWPHPRIPAKVVEVQASSHKFMAFWDGGAPPSGWVCVSCTGGDDFYQVFPRGAATAGGTGGSGTHTHSPSFVSHTEGAGTVIRGGQVNFTSASHTHTFSGGSVGAGTNLPTYQNLKIIRYDTVGDPPNIPDGAIVMFDADPGTGWTRYSTQDSDMIRGENDATGTGGAATHTHSVSGTLDATSDFVGRATGVTVASKTHTHTVSGNTASSDHTPLYRDVLLYKNTSGSAKSLVGGEIFLSTGDPGSGWTTLSGSGGEFENRFLRGASSYGGTGGASTHTPSNATITSGSPSGTGSSESTSGASAGSSTHTHNVTISFGASSTGNLPPYRNVIIAKKDAAPEISVAITSDGAITYGTVTAGQSTNTVTLTDTQTAQNDGDVTEDFNIKTSNATGGTPWTIGSEAGDNIFVHEFSINGGGNWTKFTAADSYQTLSTGVGVSSTVDFDLRITVPTDSDGNEKTIEITIQAVAN